MMFEVPAIVHLNDIIDALECSLTSPLFGSRCWSGRDRL